MVCFGDDPGGKAVLRCALCVAGGIVVDAEGVRWYCSLSLACLRIIVWLCLASIWHSLAPDLLHNSE